MTLAKFSDEASARPPETMILAEPSSGRSDFESSSPTKLEDASAPAAATASIAAAPPVPAAGNDAVCTVTTFFASRDWTVWMALPA